MDLPCSLAVEPAHVPLSSSPTPPPGGQALVPPYNREILSTPFKIPFSAKRCHVETWLTKLMGAEAEFHYCGIPRPWWSNNPALTALVITWYLSGYAYKSWSLNIREYFLVSNKHHFTFFIDFSLIYTDKLSSWAHTNTLSGQELQCLSIYQLHPTPSLSQSLTRQSTTSRSYLEIYINTKLHRTFRGEFPSAMFISPTYGKELMSLPSLSFLISHSSGQKLLFDLGVRKDYKDAFPVALTSQLEPLKITIEKDIPEILEDHGIPRKEINAIIWSHQHFDHVGNPNLFPSSTDLIVGANFKAGNLPGYPTNPDSWFLEKDLEGRNVREITFNTGLKIGRFDALDYFKDGSFYLLDTPGHTIGHLSALARVTTSPDTFVFMGGDICHHVGEFRPTVYRPFPTSIDPSPLPPFCGACPGSIFEAMHHKKSANAPFNEVVPTFTVEPGKGEWSREGTEEFDAQDNVLVVIAHDEYLMGVIDLFPKSIEGWKGKEDGVKARWMFLRGLKDDREEETRSAL